MPLLRPVPLQPATAVGGVHFIAIGGAGMSGIAAAYHALGVPVSGSDRSPSPALDHLARLGITTFVGHDAAQLGEAETVVVSSAIKPDNPELADARRRGLRVWHRSAALGALMLGRRGVAVTGTHGKTTTSGMIATMLVGVGADPGYVIGSPLAATGESSALGTGEAFVVEADESDGSFLQYPAEIVAVTNIEADHLDNWGTPAAYVAGFAEMAGADGVRTVVLSADDPHTPELAAALAAAGKQVVTVGEGSDADVRLTDLELTAAVTRARLVADGDEGALELAVPGRYNLQNAAAAYAVGRALGHDGPALRSALADFAGTHRRFEYKGALGGVRVYDDYAHHPTEVAAALAAARTRVEEGGRLVAVFQPHLFSRTRDFAGEFADALRAADLVVVCGIYPAREDAADFPGVSADLIARPVADAGTDTLLVPGLAAAADALAARLRPGDLVVTLGAGDITTLGPLVLARLGERR
ncbi:UDP-N-acetylmuramate--L-alanine ligase [Propioniciclava sp.]|uniref:UDP-N-acetylmuramate--L-alanine ligase n=1 Tax=Propioniciclava sp. TaxID=2038686 RepID=UPI00262043FD|nr:UDP-N-acetylmuramate--L-alanine ligase [Propioniciclava sp.]